jgi:hypothetical protein
MKKVLNVTFAMLFVCFLHGCSNEKSKKVPEKGGQPKSQSMTLDGYTLPGTVEVAKSNGFTDCDRAYKCKKNGDVFLLGVRVEDAFVELRESGNAGYSKITFTIPRVSLDKKCAQKAKNFIENQKCILPSELDKFKKRLLELKWKKDPVIYSRYVAYYNPDVEIKILVNGHDQGNVSLVLITSAELFEKMNGIKKYEADVASETKKADSFIDAMKQP